MKQRGPFSVSKFAELSRTTRATLHYYDKIGLLVPVTRGKNKYRHYSSGQVGFVNMVRILQALGMPLEAIRDMALNRTPETACERLACQIEKVDAKMAEWADFRKFLLAYLWSIRSALGVDEHAITVQSMPEEPIMLGNLNNYSMGRNDFDALLAFYQAIEERYPELDLSYPVWGFFSAERLRQGDWTWPERFYFLNPDGPDKRPAALYAIAYTRGGYGQHTGVFARLVKHIEENKLEICGDAYVEYPLNEICIADDTNYLLRVMIAVREKKAGG